MSSARLYNRGRNVISQVRIKAVSPLLSLFAWNLRDLVEMLRSLSVVSLGAFIEAKTQLSPEATHRPGCIVDACVAYVKRMCARTRSRGC